MVSRLLALIMVAGAAAAGQAHAQASGGASGPAVDPVIVAGRRLVPSELESRSAACLAAVEDPYVRELVNAGIGVFTRTRPPRNPDYDAPPLVLPDAPPPEVRSLNQRGVRGLSQTAEGENSQALAYAAAIAQCNRRTGPPGGNEMPDPAAGSEFFWRRLTVPSGPHAASISRADQISGPGRARIKANDTTLPLAFALFDQGRYELALEAFKVAHKKLPDIDGGDEAALMIGKLYLYGLREKSNPLEAVSWLKRAAGSYFDPGRHKMRFDPSRPKNTTALGEAAMILAGLYGEGHGPIARDPAQARKFLERAVEVGYVPASKELGDIHYEGRDTPRDAKKAFRHYLDAATFAYAPAAVTVARMYAEGEAPGGVDLVKAAAWNNEAAKFDDPGALYAMAMAYDHGEGVAPDPERALGFYKIAAVNGHAPAQTAIGTYFYKGEGVAQDLEVARSWFEQAALAADPDGMFNFAAMLARGEGGEADPVRAWGWLQIAGRAGHPEATAAARALETSFTAQDRSGAEALTASLERPAAAGPGPDPDRVTDPAFVGVAPGGPPWWKVSKDGAAVWVLGLPTGRARAGQAWNTAPLRKALDEARLVIAPYEPWSRVKVVSGPFSELPKPLGDKVVAAAVRVRQPLRNRLPTLSDVVRVHGNFYRARRLSDAVPLDVYRLTFSKKIAVVTPQKRPGPKLETLYPGGEDVAACVEAVLADLAIPVEPSHAASAAWAAGDVAGALAAPANVRWACGVLWPNYRERTIGFTTEAIAIALEMPGKVVATADLGHLVAKDGILARLRDRGFEVSGPMQPTGQ